MLEVAMDDFKKMSKDAQAYEDTATKDFKEMKAETLVRSAVFRTDIEMNSREEIQLKVTKDKIENDLRSYGEQLDDLKNYLEKLQASCVVQGPSYEERTAKREEELQSLKDALEYLNNHED